VLQKTITGAVPEEENEIMEARMGNPAMVVPGAMKALIAVGTAALEVGGLPKELHELLDLRASQINGCGVCIHGHAAALKKAGESDEKINLVAAWRDAPFFTDAERAALALAEAVTRAADNRGELVSDELWAEVSKHYTEEQIGALLLTISSVNVWNRINAATRQVAGQAW
jgi:AhpD family alkylhydroperoxidase